ncbi:MAG: MBL fold metallo-hydrolase [Euryarchaeota archaeon]|nr:MBL fold metallo-hydrolase [Euryarchaeota archaeon]
MISLDILTIGELTRDADGNVLEAHSTSTLVRAGGLNIVVDTSSPDRRPHLKTSFRQLGVLPRDVDVVVLTHSHHDHVGNNDMFAKAEILIHAGEETEIAGARIVREDIVLTEGVRLVHTPGHTPGSMSVFIEADRRYAIAGDAIPLKDNHLQGKPPRYSHDSALALESLKKITDYADMVIPGHDRPFMTGR